MGNNEGNQIIGSNPIAFTNKKKIKTDSGR